ncbi:hypothetical protein QVD17_27862 [Tagetes erecta]|uniref:NB-ARC n=1 Tax=Tagetes erecta TaxID=13708 RepID=A0AAD8KCA3_TARER|nr:hypothetical protein QVD17_27862 [Tagetes erecta]
MAFAETIASALLNVIFEKLANEAFDRYVRSQGIHSELKNLGRKLSRIKALLNDASQKEIKDEAVKQWLNVLQHLAYDIDDVLDDVATEGMHRELSHKSGTMTNKVRKLIPTCCMNFSLSHRLHHKLDHINNELEHLYKAQSSLGLTIRDEKTKSTSRRKETSLLESNVIGREVEKEKLLNKLLQDEPSKENFSIIPIVGMGGVGKTTLARLLYNDTRVNDHFELKAWVCVSDEFDIFKISETIFQSVATKAKKFKDINQLQIALREQLKDKRFLLVLDDVWNENYAEWENLVRPFHSGATESRIIITTRKQQLLKKLGFKNLDNLESLSNEDALSLIAIHALGEDNFDSHATLKPQGEGIVKKCGGLPLALKAIGRLLRTKSGREDWDDVLNSEIWDLENADEVVPALRLSYHDLSPDLKQLFAYCSLFPKDFLFDKDELVLLWMAEGYLNHSATNKSSEHSGHEYFEKLLLRSFFQHAPDEESLFVMHDLMNDLAIYVSRDYFLRFDKEMDMAEGALAKYRHMSFVREDFVAYQKFETFKRAKSLRTFLAVSCRADQNQISFYLSNKILDNLIPNLPLLRVLCLSQFEISEIPDSIGSLKHLRHLDLSFTNIRELPENTGNLYNLETLIVLGCERLIKLPKSFLKLKKLRHFDTADTPILKKFPLGIGDLRSIQTLTRIIVGEDTGFRITELKGLENLCGYISIEGLNTVQSPMQAREANLSKKGLTNLELIWDESTQNGTHEKEVLNELKPDDDKLKVLSVVSYGGAEFPSWVGDPSFHNLVHVSLRGCRKCTSLPPLGKLPSLKELLIQGMDEVEVIGSELTTKATPISFPSLETLVFEDMRSIESFPDLDISNVTSLRNLDIVNCPNIDNSFPRGLWPPKLVTLGIVGFKKPILEWGTQNFPTSLLVSSPL